MTVRALNPVFRRLAMAAALVFVLAGLAGCAADAPDHVGGPMPGEPSVRVRILRQASEVRVESNRSLRLTPIGVSRGGTIDRGAAIAIATGVWTIDGAARLDFGAATLELTPADADVDATLLVDGRPYPGLVQLVPRRSEDGPAEQFDVINHVHMEAYLPGVLDRELYPGWHLATYHAQAIAARSYALRRILDASPSSTYDVESTQAAQAYLGTSDNPNAILGVLETTGLVLSEDNRVVKAYFASTCGGAGMSPDDAFANDEHWTCLEPAPRDPWCRASKHFTWGPIRRDLVSLGNRFAAWGRRMNHPVRDLGVIRDITVSERNVVGRPTRFTIVDNRGDGYDLSADEFRVAANGTQAGPLPSDRRLKSAFIDLRIDGGSVMISGRGFGHGIGLCQFGAEAMADAGHDAADILATYYPGAKIERAY